MKKQFTILFILIAVLLPLSSFAKIDDTHIRSVVQILIYNNNQELISSGSGISIGGTAILTNYHVAEDIIKYPNSYKAIVCLTEKSQSASKCDYMAHAYYRFGAFKASVEYQEELDLAVIYINSKKDNNGTWKSRMDLPMSEFNFSSVDPAVYGYELTGIELGDEVQTLGFPDYGDDTITYSRGVISNFWSDDGAFFNNHDGVLAIGTDAKISHGSSGGAAFDKDGKFLGVTSQGIFDDNGNFMSGVIIPVTTFNWWWEKVLGNEISDWFGYTTGTIPEDVKKEVICSSSGKTYDKVLNKCVYGDDYYDAICKKDYDQNSYYTGKMTDEDETICGCLNGYIWKGNSCVSVEEKNQICEVGVFYFPAAPRRSADVRRMYGPQSDVSCECPDNYIWQGNVCVINKNQPTVIQNQGKVLGETDKKNAVIAEEKSLITKIDASLSKRVGGKILLQVEKNGEGWYVYPDNKKKYYLGRPVDAFSIMRNLGLGVKHSELAGYLTAKFPSRLSGKIMLDVEQNGEAYYVNPDDLKGYYLSRPADAFRIMRELGLGITNTDIRQIDVGEIE